MTPLFWILLIIVCLWLLSDGNKPNGENDQIVFTSRFTRGGNLFYPERLIFDPENITLKSNDGVNSLYTTTRSQMIPNGKVTGYKISRYLIGCNITIIGDGYQSILAIGYDGKDADHIETILKTLLNK